MNHLFPSPVKKKIDFLACQKAELPKLLDLYGPVNQNGHTRVENNVSWDK